MSRYTGPRVKLCKRLGVNIFFTNKCQKALGKVQKGRQGGRKTLSDFGQQLREKQVARFMFGVTEKQFSLYFEKASRLEGVTGTELLRLLERRLDNVLFRAGIADTRAQARQMVSHGHFDLNGRRVTVPSIQVRPGDVLTLRSKMQSSPLYVGFGELDSMKWLSVNASKKTVSVERLPEDDELEQIINAQLIVEYYSR